jgi:dimethylhistidine N-methyltransferase
VSQFRADVLRGLRSATKELPCKYFYDAAGAQLFEEICTLDEYYLTRTELAIMQRHAPAMAHLLGPNCLLIEYGSGTSIKTRLLLDHLSQPAAYVPIDISGVHLQETALRLRRQYPRLVIVPLCADFVDLPALPIDPKAHKVVYFPGSTIGNFTPGEATRLLRRTAQMCGPGGGLLLGADLQKDPRVHHAAYNDTKGITAAFNLNLLKHINRELDADFRLDRFWHHAPYNPREGRVEMYLISRERQAVHAADEEFILAKCEPIRTEYSYKYTMNDLADIATSAGFEVRQHWNDEQDYFTVQYLVVR